MSIKINSGTSYVNLGVNAQPCDTLSNLQNKPRQQGYTYYATDTQKMYIDNGYELKELGMYTGSINIKKEVPCKLDPNKIKTIEDLREIVSIFINAWDLDPNGLGKEFVRKYATDEFLQDNLLEYSDMGVVLTGEE